LRFTSDRVAAIGTFYRMRNPAIPISQAKIAVLLAHEEVEEFISI
jgi:hypothetical protein